MADDNVIQFPPRNIGRNVAPTNPFQAEIDNVVDAKDRLSKKIEGDIAREAQQLKRTQQEAIRTAREAQEKRLEAAQRRVEARMPGRPQLVDEALRAEKLSERALTRSGLKFDAISVGPSGLVSEIIRGPVGTVARITEDPVSGRTKLSMFVGRDIPDTEFQRRGDALRFLARNVRVTSSGVRISPRTFKFQAALQKAKGISGGFVAPKPGGDE